MEPHSVFMQALKISPAPVSFLHAHCLREWVPALAANLKLLEYRKGETIFTEGSAVTGVYFMLSGVAKVHKYWNTDKELIVRFAHNQDILGHRGLSSTAAAYPITATTLTAVKLYYISVEFFEATFKVNKDFAFAFLMFMADELQRSEIQMRNLAHMTVRARLAGALLALESKFGRSQEGFIAFTISRQDLAAYVGTAYETVYKIMHTFIELEYIQQEGKKIAILNRQAIQKAIC